jgi:ATP-dependent DNA ligase
VGKLTSEGLVLKADDSVYVDTQLRWVKLKASDRRS